MKIRITFVIVSFVALSWGASAMGGQWEVQGALEALFASDSLWDQATAGEVKAVYWLNDLLGCAVCTGVSQWNVNGKTRQVAADRWQSWKGDAQHVPVGVSILAKGRGSQDGRFGP